ncbi:hypothetical protein [Aquicoccus sp. SU-CL01552]|uniref:hypothetical protein n=1 Tax=Aquicoccus sp. SU-CL01552 TaxID=3127656 RepID=UPI00333E505C
MKASALALEKMGLSFVYGALIILYCAIYAPYGLENNDGGFLLGLSHQFSEGAGIYDDIIYIRPPASIIFHSINFTSPLGVAPVLSSRIVYFVQIGIYSAATATLFANYLKLNSIGLLLLASACFIFNAHNFPPMAWHTVDGIFFSVLAIFFSVKAQAGATSTKFIKLLLASLLGLLAALSKQPFYITPILVGVIASYPLSLRKLGITVIATFLGGVLLWISLTSFLDINGMLNAIVSQTSARDLVSAGVLNYAQDWYSLRSIITVGPLASVLLIWAFGRASGRALVAPAYLRFALILSVTIYMISFLQVFVFTDRWVSPRSLFDTLFTITALVSTIEAIRTRKITWLVLTALHGVSWAASISWGYTTVALFSAPSIITITIVGMELIKGSRTQLAASTIASVAAASTFFFGSQFLYSLEGPVRRSDVTVSIGPEFPALRGIWVSATKADELRELKILRSKFGENLVVLPNWPLYNTIFDGRNPIGMDWPLNTEVGPFDRVVQSRLGQVDVALVFRNANPSPASEGRFGSQITQSVIESWSTEDFETKYFDVYLNPSH